MIRRSFARALKKVRPMDYLVIPEEQKKAQEAKTRPDDWIEIPIEKYSKGNVKRGLHPDEKPIPVSPYLHPLTVKPKTENLRPS